MSVLENIKERIMTANSIYTVDHKILIYFPESDKSCKESKAFLNYALTHCILPIRIGYVIPNKSGACIIRIELPDLYT